MKISTTWSSNTYKKKHRKFSSWPLVALGGLLIAVSVILLVQAADPGGGGKPSIPVDQELIDHGYVKYGDAKQFRIQVTNTGDGVLSFKVQPRVDVLEGC